MKNKTSRIEKIAKQEAANIGQHYSIEPFAPLRFDIAQSIMRIALRERKRAIRECAESLPTNWCDPRLTGKGNALGQQPWGCSQIENLVLALRKRILALSTPVKSRSGGKS